MAFSYYKTFTTDHTQCGTADSTDFPITIFVTDADLKTVGNGGYVQNSNGYDIRPYADSALTSALTFELVFYDGTNGILEMHVKVTTLDHVSDTIRYLAFGDSGISTDGSSTATWASYGLVNHYKDGTTLSVADSSANNFTGASVDTTATSGLIDGAALVNHNVSNAGITVTNGYNVISGDDTNTVSLWVWVNSYATIPAPLLYESTDAPDAGAHDRALAQIDSGHVYWAVRNTTDAFRTYNTAVGTGAWHHLFFVKTGAGDSGNFYLDSSLQTVASGALESQFTMSNRTWYWGRYFDLAFELDGKLDETRISPIALSASWVTAEYNNQKPSSTFLTWGTKTAVGKRFILIPN